MEMATGGVSMKRAACVLFFSLLPSVLFAWHVNTHLQMTRDAVALMPADLQKAFLEHQKFVEAGIKDPDELLRDWQNHYYIPTNPPEGGALDRIDKIIAVVRMKSKSGSDSDISKQLCYMAHYIGDLWSPESILKQTTTPDAAFTKNNNIVVLYDGYPKPIANIREYLQARSEWRWRLENSKEVSTLLYSEAVNDIARVWLTLYQESGRNVEPQGPNLLFHKKNSLSVNFERLLLEEYYTWDSSWGESSWSDAAQAHNRELERLAENVAPSDEKLYAMTEARNQMSMLSKVSPTAPFKMIESSLKTVGERSYFVARIGNNGSTEIPSIAFMYPGVRGPLVLIKALKPGQVIKVEASLPANATKDQIQLIFASQDQ